MCSSTDFFLAVNGGGGEWNDGRDAGAAGFTDSSNMNGGDFGFTNQDARGDVDGEATNDGKCHNCGGGKLQVRHHYHSANSV